MSEIHIGKEQHIGAPAEQVYSLIADYAGHHEHFLPEAFSQYRVEEGGYGAGTVISYHLKVLGRDQAARAHIEEPVPGQVLKEYIDGTDMVTTFTVTPDGAGTLLRIETRWQSKRGIAGRIERAVATRALLPLYEAEMKKLDAYARAQTEDAIPVS